MSYLILPVFLSVLKNNFQWTAIEQPVFLQSLIKPLKTVDSTLIFLKQDSTQEFRCIDKILYIFCPGFILFKQMFFFPYINYIS